MVTAATFQKQLLFNTAEKLDQLETELLNLAKHYDLHLHAWAVFANHYHFDGRSEQENPNFKTFLSHLHSNTAREVNRTTAQRDERSGITFGTPS